MRYLIVNADDLGASPGVNRGIIEAHTQGIVTSASLMVDTPWSEQAAEMAMDAPELSIGLHAEVSATAGGESSARCVDELERQLERFAQLTGHLPTHLDSHHNAHRDGAFLPAFLELATRHDLPLREHSAARYVSSFYGQWGGESHPEQVSVSGLLRIVDAEASEGITELACHPGYADPDLHSGYDRERELELRTLRDAFLRGALGERGFQLISFRELMTPRQTVSA